MVSSSTYYNNNCNGYYCLWVLFVCLYVLELMWRQPPALLLWFQNSLIPKPFKEALLLSDLWLQWKVGAQFLHDEESMKAWNEVCLSNTKSSEKNRKLSQYLDYSSSRLCIQPMLMPIMRTYTVGSLGEKSELRGI